MNLLVTGGAGFIGSHFALRHKEQFPDDFLVVLDSLSHGSDKAFLDPIISRIRFVHGDIADVDLLKATIDRYGIDTVVNFAAETHVDRSIGSAVPFLHSNVLGVQAFIEVLRKYPEVRLLHISTDEVYGDVKDGEEPRKTTDMLKPSSPYAATKAAGELLLFSAARTYGLKVAITRCTNNYGPHQAQEKLIPTIIRHALKNEPVPLYAKGLNKRDWLYVTDHTDAVELVLTNESLFASALEPHERVINVSADDERPNIDVAKSVLGLLKKPESLISFVSDRPGHDWRYAIDSSAIRKMGWSPKITFEDGLRQTVEWYRGRP